jgi:signal transduction histidine kinase
MSSLESIYEKLKPNLPTAASPQPSVASPDQSRQISREVAHELNNVLTIVRGYADRLIMKHGENPALRPELQLISDNARRAERVIRAASQAKPVVPVAR